MKILDAETKEKIRHKILATLRREIPEEFPELYEHLINAWILIFEVYTLGLTQGYEHAEETAMKVLNDTLENKI